MNMTTWMDSLDGSVTIRIYANDTLGNLEFLDILLNKDATNPQIIINEPLGGTEFGRNPPSINITLIETNIAQFWFTINDSTTKNFVSMVSGDNILNINNIIWDAIPNGHVLVSLYANDTLGNIGTLSVTYIKETSTEPPAIPGYELGILILVLSSISMIIALRRRKFFN